MRRNVTNEPRFCTCWNGISGVSKALSRIIALVNQKGGVGKSTTAVNLGAALAVRGQRVLVVDSDPQGNTTTGFGIDKGRIERDVYDVLMQQATIAEVIQPTEIEGLHVVPATINLAGAEIELVSGLSRETRMRSALAPIADTYDFTLIDCPPSLGLLTINALTAAREIVIPVQAEYYALEGLSQLTNVVRRVREALNPTLHVSGVLVTMFDGRTRLAMEVLDELERYFPEQMFKTQIPRNIRLSEAPSFGKPVILFDIKSRGAQAYISLAKEMLDAMPAAVEAAAR
jgi:chromosome partitioning protein